MTLKRWPRLKGNDCGARADLLFGLMEPPAFPKVDIIIRLIVPFKDLIA